MGIRHTKHLITTERASTITEVEQENPCILYFPTVGWNIETASAVYQQILESTKNPMHPYTVFCPRKVSHNRF